MAFECVDQSIAKVSSSLTRDAVYPSSSLLAFVHALYHDLDAALFRICCDLECFNSILELEAVRDQLREVDHASLQQPNGSRPCVCVPVLELKVDLPRAQSHEGDLDLRPADTNDKHLATELRRMDSTRDGRLDPSALHHHGRLHTIGLLYNSLGEILRRVAELHLVRADARAELLGELQPALIDIRDDNRLGSSSLDTSQRDQSNRPSSTDQHAVTQSDIRPLHARQRHAQRFQKCAVLKAHVANLVTPHRWVVDISPQQTWHRRCRPELDLLATIVAAGKTRLALAADDVGLDGDAVADLVRSDRRVLRYNDAGGFVAEDVRVFYDHGTNAAGVPEVDIGTHVLSAQSSGLDGGYLTRRYRCS